MLGSQVEMRKELLLYPRHFGPNVQDILLEKLITSVEGSCSGRYGFVVCVTDIFETGKGKIREGTHGASERRNKIQPPLVSVCVCVLTRVAPVLLVSLLQAAALPRSRCGLMPLSSGRSRAKSLTPS